MHETATFLFVTLPNVHRFGLEACPLLKSDLSSVDFVVNRLFMKLFKTSHMDVVKCCLYHFGVDLPSVSWSRRAKKFEAKFHAEFHVVNMQRTNCKDSELL